MGRLVGKVAVVAGAAAQGEGVGNGSAIAQLFAREGAKVVLVNRSEERAAGKPRAERRRDTYHGGDIDAQCHVLHDDGRPFGNLLAAGGAARGVSGNAVWGYLSGNGLLSAMAGGYIAAHSAVNLLKTQP